MDRAGRGDGMRSRHDRTEGMDITLERDFKSLLGHAGGIKGRQVRLVMPLRARNGSRKAER